MLREKLVLLYWRAVGIIAAAVVAVGVFGCHDKVWRAQVTQPKLRLTTNQTQRTSLPLVIANRGSRGLSTTTIRRAYFVVVSRDRLRFHVTIHHKWDHFADPEQWQVWIEDANGRRLRPEALDRRVIRPVVVRGKAINFYRGDGSYTFYHRDLFTRDMSQLTLVMWRPGWEYRYHWAFQDGIETDPDERVAGRQLK